MQLLEPCLRGFISPPPGRRADPVPIASAASLGKRNSLRLKVEQHSLLTSAERPHA